MTSDLHHSLAVFIDKIRSFFQGEIRQNEPLSQHCSLQIGGNADYFLLPRNKVELIQVFSQLVHDSIPYFVLGRGTNLLFHDNGFQGVVLCIKHVLEDLHIQEQKVTVGAGHSLPKLVQKSIQAGLGGIETLGGIPGTVGGAVIMNAGAYGNEIFDFIQSVEIIQKNGEIATLLPSQIDYSYRHTNLRNHCILGIELELPYSEDPIASAEKRKELLSKRKKSQPVEKRNAGSAFKNPPGNFAGKLIEECDLKGFQIGGAQISTQHANFLLNTNQATSQNMWELIQFTRQKVWERFQIKLELEWELVGFPASDLSFKIF